MRILVVGASGYIGGRLVPLLAAQSHDARLDQRRGATAGRPVPAGDGRRSRPPGTSDVAIGARRGRRGLLPRALDGSGERGFAERDRQAASNFAEAAKHGGVSRIVYLGGLGDDFRLPLQPPGHRHETGAQLAARGVPVTEFRAAVIIGSGSASFEILRHLTERLPIMITPRWVETRCQPIGIADALDYLVGALDHPEVTGVVEIGGPDILSYGDMMRSYARLRGLRRLIIPVPVLTPRLSSYWVNPISPVPAGIARPLIEGLRNEVVVRDAGPAAAFGIHPRSYVEALARAIDRSDRYDVESPGSTRSPRRIGRACRRSLPTRG